MSRQDEDNAMKRAVVIGSGAMGRRHIQAVSRSREYVFAGVSDLNPAALEQARAEGVAAEHCFTDTETMLDAVAPDCVVVSTTATSHMSLARTAILRGVKNIVVEKPYTVSIAQARELNALSAAHGTRLAVNHGMRYDAHYGMIKDVAASEALGPLTSVNFSGGNMGVAMNGSHLFELFRFLTGGAPHRVAAWFDPQPVQNPRGPQFKDMAGQIRAENAAGQRLYMEIGSDQGHGLSLHIVFRYGSLYADLLNGRIQVNRRKAEHRDMPTTRYGMPFDIVEYDIPRPDPVDTATKLLDALAAGEGYPDGEVGERVVRSLVAAYVSNENGHVGIDIHGDLPEDRVFPWA